MANRLNLIILLILVVSLAFNSESSPSCDTAELKTKILKKSGQWILNDDSTDTVPILEFRVIDNQIWALTFGSDFYPAKLSENQSRANSLELNNLNFRINPPGHHDPIAALVTKYNNENINFSLQFQFPECDQTNKLELIVYFDNQAIETYTFSWKE